MMANLFPVFGTPGTLVEERRAEQVYKQSPLFDIERGDFVVDGAGRMVYGSGYDAWVLWCTKTIMTQRWAHMGYSSNVGVEAIEAFAEKNRAAVQSVFERSITEALLADPQGRTQYVRDFNFTWRADSLYITCLAIGADGDSASIKAEIGRDI